jgi:transposase
MAADLALAAGPEAVERSADPAGFVVAAYERARAWLREALEHGEIEQIAELKSQAEAVRVYTAQKQLGKDAQLAAAEIVRRAERGIGVAIRRGQQCGAIRCRGGHGGRAAGNGDGNTISRPGPADYATTGELRGNGAGIYHMTDGVSDEDFEEALAEAKTEQDLSRANVVRKIRRRRSSSPGPGEQIPAPADRSSAAAQARRKLIGELAGHGMSSRQIADQLGIGDHRVRAVAREHGIAIPADAVLGRTRRLDSSRIVRQTAHALEGLVMGVELADPAELDPAEAAAWVASITCSTRALSRFARQIKEAFQ